MLPNFNFNDFNFSEKEFLEREVRILFDKGDKLAFQKATQGHFKGYPKCSYMLACCYVDGIGVGINNSEANKLFDACYEGLVLEANNDNDAISMGFLGEYYKYGLGSYQVDLKKAIYWYERAANEGIAECKFFLGEMYLDKNNPFYDRDLAYKWFQRASSQGLEEATKIVKNWKK